MAHFYVYVFTIYVTCCALGEGSSLTDAAQLNADLLQNYSTDLRPVADQNSALAINISFNIVAVQAFDEKLGKLSLVSYLDLKWFDASMSWNSALYNGVDMTAFPRTKVWYPHLFLKFPFGHNKAYAGDDFWVRFYSNGKAEMTPGAVIEAACVADLTYFPFDTQTCTITLTDWNYFASQLVLVSTLDEIMG